PLRTLAGPRVDLSRLASGPVRRQELWGAPGRPQSIAENPGSADERARPSMGSEPRDRVSAHGSANTPPGTPGHDGRDRSDAVERTGATPHPGRSPRTHRGEHQGL